MIPKKNQRSLFLEIVSFQLMPMSAPTKMMTVFIAGGIVGIVVAQSSGMSGGDVRGRLTLGGPYPPPRCGTSGASCTNADPQCCSGLSCQPSPNGSRACQATPPLGSCESVGGVCAFTCPGRVLNGACGPGANPPQRCCERANDVGAVYASVGGGVTNSTPVGTNT